MAEEYDVVVIGAGLSGLVAAYSVLKEMPSAKVAVLEASDRIGGPIENREFKTTKGTGVFDIGSARIGTEQKELLALINELGLETYDQYGKGNKFWQLTDGKVKKWSGNIPPLPYTSLLDLLRFFKKVDSLSSEVNLENPAASKHAAEWDKQNIEEFRKSVLWTEVARETVDTMTGSFFNIDLKELKLMHYLYIVASDGGWDNHSDKEGGRKLNFKVKGGFHKVCTELVQKISESSVLTNQTVESIQQGSDQKSAIVRTNGGKEFSAKRVICAVPNNHLGTISFEPAPEIDRSAAFPEKYAMVNCVLSYSTAFWREDGYAGEVLSMCGSIGMLNRKDEHPVVGVFDHCNGDVDPALMVVLGAPGLQTKSSDERKEVVLQYLKELFGDKVMEPLDFQDLVWDTKVRGKPPTKDVKPSEILSAMRTPHGCVHWAGSYTATSWCNSLAGAAQAGQRAATEVVAALK